MARVVSGTHGRGTRRARSKPLHRARTPIDQPTPCTITSGDRYARLQAVQAARRLRPTVDSGRRAYSSERSAASAGSPPPGVPAQRPCHPGVELLFSFQDGVLLRAAHGLRQAKIPISKIVHALQRLRDTLPADLPLSGIRITADGREVAVRDGPSTWHVQSGQLLLDFDVASGTGATISLLDKHSKALTDQVEVEWWSTPRTRSTAVSRWRRPLTTRQPLPPTARPFSWRRTGSIRT